MSDWYAIRHRSHGDSRNCSFDSVRFSGPRHTQYCCTSGKEVGWLNQHIHFGLILPSTSGVDGYSAEKARGRVVTLPGGGAYSCHYRCGALDAETAAGLSDQIDRLKPKAGKVNTWESNPSS